MVDVGFNPRTWVRVDFWPVAAHLYDHAAADLGGRGQAVHL